MKIPSRIQENTQANTPANIPANSLFQAVAYPRSADIHAYPTRRLATALMAAGLIGLLGAVTSAAHAVPLKPLMESFSEATLRGQSNDGRPSMAVVSGKDINTQPWVSRGILGTTRTVTNNGDSGAGTLRDALEFQVNSCYAGPVTINFAIPTGGPAADYIIAPASPLPAITCPNTIINGYSQPGALANTLATGNDANIAISLNGASLAGAGPGLALNANFIAVRGLIVNNFTVFAGIEIQGGTNASITGNSIVGNAYGVKMTGGAYANIGGSAPAQRNTISGNDAGILLIGAGSPTGSQIINNYIGTAASGAGGQPNGSNNAIEVYVPDTIIANNLIAYNLGAGIGMLEGPAHIHDNTIFANLQGGIRVYATECSPEGISIRANNIGFPNGSGQGIALRDAQSGDVRDTNASLNNPSCYHANGGQPGSPAFAQNYPIITAVGYAWNGASVTTTVDATLTSAAGTTYDIDLFDNTFTVDTANIGIGAKYLLTAPSTTDGAGFAPIQMVASGTPVYYPSMTSSTPMGPTGGTSEFSVQANTPLKYTSTYTNYSITAGATATQTFTIQNIDTQPITVPAPTSNSPRFTIGANTCGSLMPGASCQFDLTYSQPAPSTDSATLTLGPVASASMPVAPVATQPAVTYTWALSGTAVAGTGPVFSPSATSFNWPGETVGIPGTPQTLTITNTGDSSMTIFSPVITGPFSITGNTCTGLAPAGTCTISFTFTATMAGPDSGTLTITTNAAGSPHVIMLSGTGVAATPPTMAVAINPISVGVGAVATMTLTLVNPAATKADVNATSSVTIPANLTFGGIGTNTCAATPSQAGQVFSFSTGSIPPMGTCTFDVPVQSAVPGTYTVNIGPGQLFTTGGNNANSSSNSLTVTAAATPAITLTPPSVAFGARTVNTTSPVSTVTLGNSGGAPLTITSIIPNGDFAVVTSCPLSPATLAVALDCPLDITFTPLTVSASLTGNVTIVSDAPGSPHIVPLSGAGTATPVPVVSLSTALLSFPSQVIGATSAIQTITVYNSGFATLNFSGITKTGSAAFTRVISVSEGGAFGVIEGKAPANPDCSFSVAPGGSCTIRVTFTPTAAGTVAGQINIASNASGSPHTVNLTGTGISNAVPIISVPGSIGFGDQIILTSGAQTLNITNSGGATLTISSLTVSGTNAANFVTSGTCVDIVTNATCSVVITFTPATVGAKAAQITIVSNASNQSTTTVSLTGTGILAPRPITDLSVTAIGYGNAIFGGASSGQVITLKNTGGLGLQIQSVFTTGDFVVMNSCPAVLSSGNSCVINVTFSPLRMGQLSGELVLISNAQGSPHRIPLSGTGCRWFSQAQSRFFLTSCG